MSPIERVELIPSESGGQVTFNELVEPHFGDGKPGCDGAGPRMEGPNGVGTTRTEGAVCWSHQQ